MLLLLPPPPENSETQSVVVSFGPDFAPLEQRQVARAIEETQHLFPKPELIVFAAFQFDPEAAKDIDEIQWPGVSLIKVHMNSDLLTSDLRRKTNSQSFWLIGQPDVLLEKVEGQTDRKFRVKVLGFDYYDTVKGELISGGSQKIAMWMLDPDYDGRSLFPKQIFFPKEASNKGWNRLAKTLQSEIDLNLIEKYQGIESLPFKAGEHSRIAIKVIDDRGIESLKIINLKSEL